MILDTVDSKNRRLIVLALSVVVLPLLIVSAFSASLAVVPNTSPLFHPANFVPGNYSYSYVTGNGAPLISRESLTQNISVPPGSIQLFPSISPFYITLAVVVLFALAAFGIAYNLRLSGRRNLAFSPLEERVAQKTEVAKILDLAISRLKRGEEFRKTVLECYKMISEILESKSAIEGRTYTAREFQNLVSTKLNFKSPYLDQATELFEVARYSESEVTESHARAAIDCLQNLRADLMDNDKTG